MQKKKKLFTYESESINTKELEEDLRQAEQLITKLKDQVDPNAEKLRRRRERLYYLFDILYVLLSIFFSLFIFFAGYSVALDQAEKLYNYSVTVGAINALEETEAPPELRD